MNVLFKKYERGEFIRFDFDKWDFWNWHPRKGLWLSKQNIIDEGKFLDLVYVSHAADFSNGGYKPAPHFFEPIFKEIDAKFYYIFGYDLHEGALLASNLGFPGVNLERRSLGGLV